MDLHTRNEYMKALKERYCETGKKEKSRILDEYCRNTGQNRKYVINKFWVGSSMNKKRKRKPLYDSEVINALSKCWEIFDHPCGQRLTPILRAEVERIRGFGELNITDKTASRLKNISPRTIDRRLRLHKEKIRGQMKYSGKKSRLLYHKIPIRGNDWDTFLVGQIEIDSVEHCGASTEGEYIHSISTVDIASGWWEGQAILGKSQQRSFDAIEMIRARTPFKWAEMHPDNDSMFINWHIFRYAEENNIKLSRSRPYKKNDNCFVEQKNSTHIRRIMGYLRHDSSAELKIINSLYENELRLYKNFFQPVMKLKEKSREKGKIHRKYDAPKTPFQRLMGSGQIAGKVEKNMKSLYDGLNPAELKRNIDKKLGALSDAYTAKNQNTALSNRTKKICPITRPASVRFYMAQQQPVRLGI